MFARMRKSGNHQYLQIVENRKVHGQVFQRVMATIGRMDRLQTKGQIETLIRYLSRFSENVLLILSGKSHVSAIAEKVGPALIFERLCSELGIKERPNHPVHQRKVASHIPECARNRVTFSEKTAPRNGKIRKCMPEIEKAESLV